MKKLIPILILILVFAGLAVAENQVTLAWDVPQADIDQGDFGGWKIHSATVQGGPYSESSTINYDASFDYQAIITIPEIIGDSVTYYFVVTAFDTAENESGYSNEVSKEFTDTTSPGVTVNVRIIEE